MMIVEVGVPPLSGFREGGLQAHALVVQQHSFHSHHQPEDQPTMLLAITPQNASNNLRRTWYALCVGAQHSVARSSTRPCPSLVVRFGAQIKPSARPPQLLTASPHPIPPLHPRPTAPPREQILTCKHSSAHSSLKQTPGPSPRDPR